MKSYHYYIRKTHRYLGLFIGIQFLLWTLGGLFFSWTNIDRIHGDHLVNRKVSPAHFPDRLFPLDKILDENRIPHHFIQSVALMPLHSGWYYQLIRKDTPIVRYFDAQNGMMLPPMDKKEALQLTAMHYRYDYPPDKVKYITEENKDEHLDYRGGALPAWGIHYSAPEDVWLYYSARHHRLEKVRTGRWRLFDFLWMLHIMDFDERDNINNSLLRVFSILGLLTILSGFALFFVSSRTIRRWRV